MKTKLFISFLLSILCFLVTCWTAKYTVYAEGWTQSVCYFALTYILLNKYLGDKPKYLPIVLAIMAGRIILGLPFRILNFYDSLFSLFVPIIALISIILAATCHKEKRVTVFLMAIIILILLNTITHHAWVYYVRNNITM